MAEKRNWNAGQLLHGVNILFFFDFLRFSFWQDKDQRIVQLEKKKQDFGAGVEGGCAGAHAARKARRCACAVRSSSACMMQPKRCASCKRCSMHAHGVLKFKIKYI
jgi:hypothetical protein